MIEGAQMSVWIGAVFYRYCMRYHVTAAADRTAVLRRLVAKKKAVYLRDPMTTIQGKRVLRIGRKGEQIYGMG